MADLIRIKGGSGDVPTLQDRELAYSKDEKALYIGADGEHVRLCGENDVARINALYATISGMNEEMEAMRELLEDIAVRLGVLEQPSE